MTEVATKRTRAGWTTVAFGDVVRQVKDRVDPDESGLERYVAGEHMDTDDLRLRRWGDIGDGYLGPAFHMRFKPGHVLYGSRRTYLRKVAVADFEGITANTTYVLEPKDPNLLLPELLPFIMQTEAFNQHSVRESKGSVNPYVNFSDLAWFAFALPPIEEQRRFSAMLQAIESLLTGLDNSSLRAFVSWRSLSHAEFSKRAGSGPPLDIHFKISIGQVDPKKPEYAKLPLIAPNHIEPGRGRVTELVSAEAQAAISGKYLYEAGSVLYSKIRPELRKAAIAPCRGLCSADMYPLTPSQELHAGYLLEILLSDAFSRFAVSGSMRTGMPKANRKHLAQFCFDLPSTDDQYRYLNHVRSMHAAMDQLAERRTSLVSLKSTVVGELESA